MGLPSSGEGERERDGELAMVLLLLSFLPSTPSIFLFFFFFLPLLHCGEAEGLSVFSPGSQRLRLRWAR